MTESPIAIRRRRLGISQQKLATMMGCSVTTISQYEVGSFKPNAKNVMKLAKIFSISFEQMAKELGI